MSFPIGCTETSVRNSTNAECRSDVREDVQHVSEGIKKNSVS